MTRHINAILAAPLLMLILLYRYLLSPLIGYHCRFTPTCSCYAGEAIAMHGPLKGTLLSLRRVLRCHPWGGQGADPVPRIGEE